MGRQSGAGYERVGLSESGEGEKDVYKRQVLCVERVGHKNGVRNAYVARQERIEGQLPVHTGTRFGDIEVSDLRFGVNARVGPSCTCLLYTSLPARCGHQFCR